jgi:hypothetical protein
VVIQWRFEWDTSTSISKANCRTHEKISSPVTYAATLSQHGVTVLMRRQESACDNIAPSWQPEPVPRTIWCLWFPDIVIPQRFPGTQKLRNASNSVPNFLNCLDDRLIAVIISCPTGGLVWSSARIPLRGRKRVGFTGLIVSVILSKTCIYVHVSYSERFPR